MGYLLAIGVSAGIIAGIFSHLVFVAQVLNVLAWVSFVGEACFFAAGGKGQGLLKGLAANFAGVFWAAFIFFLVGVWKSPVSMGVAVCIAVIMMCVQAKFNYLSFIPGAFAGCACLFATASQDFPSGNWKVVLIDLVLGAVMGYLAEQGATIMMKMFNKKSAAIETNV